MSAQKARTTAQREESPQAGQNKESVQAGQNKESVQAGQNKESPQAGQNKEAAQAGQNKESPQAGQNKEAAQAGQREEAAQKAKNSRKSSEKQRISLEERALRVSMWGGIFFVSLELLMSIVSSSQAVLMDAAYDGSELVTTVASLWIVPLLYKPLTEKRPFGYCQVETWFIVIKGFMLLSITLGLVANNVQIMLRGGRHVDFAQVAYFELFAACVGVFVTILLKRWNSSLRSPMVCGEINSWQVDAIASGGMALAFLAPRFLGGLAVEGLTPYLDQIVAIVLTVFILPRPVKMVLSGMRDLLLLAPEQQVTNRIKEISAGVMEKEHFRDQFEEATYDIVRMGRRFWVAIYVTSKTDALSIKKWSDIQREIQEALTEEFHDVYVELLPDIG